MLGELQAVGDVEPHPFPDFLLPEAAAHQVAALDHELLAVGPLGRGQLGVVVAQGQAAEGHVPGLVLHDEREQLLDQRVGGHVAVHAERGQGQALDQDLHAQVGEVPARVGQRVVQQPAQVVVDRVVQVDLLPHEPGEQLDVPGLVHGLGRGVELGVHVGHGLHDPRGHGQRALLTVQELAEQPGRQVMGQLVPLRLGQLLPLGRPVDRVQLAGHAHDVGRIHRQRPVDPLGRVPLLVLAPLVEAEQPVPPVVVLPGEPGVAGRRYVPGAGRDGRGVVVVGAHAASWRESVPPFITSQ